MRTKNAKRLWPVPATLTVVALAAFLAFGLMATTGAQPAAAQDDVDCEVTVGAPAEVTGIADVTVPVAPGCTAVGDTAVIEFQGSADADDDATLSLLIVDKNGAISAYPEGADWSTTIEPDGIATQSNGQTAASSMKYHYQTVVVPKAAPNASTGIVEGQKVQISVQGNVHVWGSVTSVTADIENIPTDSALDGSRSIAADSDVVNITFLGEPALGKDADTDFNKDVDDVATTQCSLISDTRTPPRIVDEGVDCAVPTTHEAIDPNPDNPDGSAVVETRSKLVIRTGTATMGSSDATVIFDGGMATHELSVDQEEVTIFALVQDAEGQNLLGTVVDFVADPVPDDIVATRDLSDDPETKKLVTGQPADTDEEIQVGGLNTIEAQTGSMVSAEAVLTVGESVAAFTLDDLPMDTSYRITVEVTVGDLSLGTVNIARTGTATKVVAGVFNIECFEMGEEDDFRDATFAPDANDDCDDSGMANHFGHGEKFVVKAHHEDALDLVVPDGDNLSVELSDEDDNLLGDADTVDLGDPVDSTNGDPAYAWVFTIDGDATLGERMITVSTDQENGDGDAIDDVMLSITVAGPPHSYDVEGPMYIPLGDSGTFTVTAMDEIGGLPHFTTAAAVTTERPQNNLVNVFVADVPSGNVRGLASGNNLELDEDTGMGTFTLYAPRDAEQGEVARIFVGSGDSEVALTVTFGDPDATPDPMERDGFAADYTVTATSDEGSGMVDVSWTRSEGLSLSLVSLIQGGEVVDFNITGLTSTEFSGVDPGEYDVSVFSFRNNSDGKDGEIAFGTVTVE